MTLIPLNPAATSGYEPDGYPCDVCGRLGWAEHDGLTLCGPCWNRATNHVDEDGTDQ